MSIQDIINLISKDGASWLVVIIIITSLVQISPLKLNPWSRLFGWLGKSLNNEVIEEVKKVDKKVDEVEQKLEDHIAESENKSLQDTRSEILSFGSSIISGNNYNKEKFDFMISKCDHYEEYCHKHEVANGVADATIKEIRRVYSLRMTENSFLREGAKNES